MAVVKMANHLGELFERWCEHCGASTPNLNKSSGWIPQTLEANVANFYRVSTTTGRLFVQLNYRCLAALNGLMSDL